MWPFDRPKEEVGREHPLVALLIDMQPYFIDGIRPEVSKPLIRAQAKVLRSCVRKHIPIIAVEVQNCGRTIRPLRAIFQNEAAGKTIQKESSDAFYSTELGPALSLIKTKTVLVMGVYASNCVWATCCNAVDRGLKVVTCTSLIADHKSKVISKVSSEWYRENRCFSTQIGELLKT